MQLFGAVTGQGLYDWWSVIHVAVWIVIGGNLKNFYPDWPFWQRWVWLVGLALMWEVGERFGEFYRPDIWKAKEIWYNSRIGDITTVLIGDTIGAFAIAMALKTSSRL